MESPDRDIERECDNKPGIVLSDWRRDYLDGRTPMEWLEWYKTLKAVYAARE